MIFLQGRGSEQTDQTVLVVDDHVAFAEAFASLLADLPGLRAFAATTVEDAQRALAAYNVNVMLLEVDLGPGNGIRFAGQALSEDPELRIIAVTASEDQNRVVDAVLAGISSWVPKDQPAKHLVSVIHGVLRGETWIPPPLLTGVLAELRSRLRNANGHEQLLTMLTRREREILGFLMGGMNADEIAQGMCLSKSTVRTHIRNILRKLHVHSTLAAVALARRALDTFLAQREVVSFWYSSRQRLTALSAHPRPAGCPSLSTRLTGSRNGRACGPRRFSCIASCSAATSFRRSPGWEPDAELQLPPPGVAPGAGRGWPGRPPLSRSSPRWQRPGGGRGREPARVDGADGSQHPERDSNARPTA